MLTSPNIVNVSVEDICKNILRNRESSVNRALHPHVRACYRDFVTAGEQIVINEASKLVRMRQLGLS